MYLLRHLISTAFRAFFRMVFVGVLCAALAAAIVFVVAYLNGPQWPPSVLTDIVAASVALLAGYASALTVLVREAVRGVSAAEHEVVKVMDEATEREKAHA